LMHLLDVGAHDTVDRLEPAECLPHSRIGELAEHGLQRLHALEPPRAALARRVEGGPDVELAAADRHEADALAVAEELGEMLEAVAVLHDEAVGPIAQIHGVVRSEESRLHRGPHADAADQAVARDE